MLEHFKYCVYLTSIIEGHSKNYFECLSVTFSNLEDAVVLYQFPIAQSEVGRQ